MKMKTQQSGTYRKAGEVNVPRIQRGLANYSMVKPLLAY